MIKRDILIANNRDQSKYRIVTGAETLGELQSDIARNEEVYKMVGQTWVKAERPIDISGLTFTEGITKTQLLSPDTQLPTNVQFKGQTTNNLVMLLTNTNKQIRSGADYPTDRKLFGTYIKQNNLGEAIKAEFGDNWTRVSTAKLLNFFANTAEKNATSNKDAINEVRKEMEDQEKVKEAVNTFETESPEVSSQENTTSLPKTSSAVNWLYATADFLTTNNLMNSTDITVLIGLLALLVQQLEAQKPDITADDLDNMLNSLD